MAVDVKKLAVVLRIQDDAKEAVAEPHSTILSDLLAWARAEVDAQAKAAPESAKDQAIYTLCGYVYDQPTAARGASYANAWDNSGAKHILRRWISRRAVILARESADDVEAPAGQIAITREQALVLIAQALAELRMSDGSFTIEEVRAIITTALTGYATLNAVDAKIATHAGVADAHQDALTETEVAALITTAIAAYHASEGVDDVDRATVIRLIEEHEAMAEAHHDVDQVQLTVIHYEARALGRHLLNIAADGTLSRPVERDEWGFNASPTGQDPVLFWKGPAQTPMGLWVVGSNGRRTFISWGASGLSGFSVTDQGVPLSVPLPGSPSELLIYGERESADTARWGVRARLVANGDGDDAGYSLAIYEAASPAIPKDLPFTLTAIVSANNQNPVAPNPYVGSSVEADTEVLTTGGLTDERLWLYVPKGQTLIGASLNIEAVPSDFELLFAPILAAPVSQGADPLPALFKLKATDPTADWHVYQAYTGTDPLTANPVLNIPAPGKIRLAFAGLSLAGTDVDEARIKVIVDAAIQAHADNASAHGPPGASLAQVSAAIAAHTAIPQAHQAPGQSKAEVEALIAAHAAIADAHQTIPPVGISATEAATLINTAIATHTAIATAHQQPGISATAAQTLIDAAIAKIPAGGAGMFELGKIGSIVLRDSDRGDLATETFVSAANISSRLYSYEDASNEADWSRQPASSGPGWRKNTLRASKEVGVLFTWRDASDSGLSFGEGRVMALQFFGTEDQASGQDQYTLNARFDARGRAQVLGVSGIQYLVASITALSRKAETDSWAQGTFDLQVVKLK